MAYIMTYENYELKYYDIKSFENDKEYSVGRNDESKNIKNDIQYVSDTISRKKGILRFKFGVPRYRNCQSSSVSVPTFFNNCDIGANEVSFELGDVLAFPGHNYRCAMLMCVPQKKWGCYRLARQNFNVCLTVDEEISFKEGIPVLEFHFIGGKYHITVPDKIEEVPIILSDRYNSEDEEITEDTIVEYERVYRILIEDYLLVIGGDIILYGTI